MSDEDPIGDTIVDLLQRATLPFVAVGGAAPGTAFLYNHLVETTSGFDRVIEFMVTAGQHVHGDVGELRLRPEMIEPVGAASDILVMTKFAEQWTHDETTGVAFTPFARLHEHGRRKGWRWTTQEVTDGLAARTQDIAAISAEPQPAYVLGHGVDGTERPLLLVRGSVRRDEHGTIRWCETARDGLHGSPVFATRATERGVKLVCLGVLLPEARDHPIATFDLIRTAIAATTRPPAQ
jgi:hypothetical protein